MAIDLEELQAIDDVKALPGGFPAPEACVHFTDDEAQDVARSLAPSIDKILRGDEAELDRLYYADGFWRDQVSLAWTFRTFQSKRSVSTVYIRLLMPAENLRIIIQAPSSNAFPLSSAELV